MRVIFLESHNSVGSCGLLLPIYQRNNSQISIVAGRREKRLNLNLNRALASSSSPENGVWRGKQTNRSNMGKELLPHPRTGLLLHPSTWHMRVVTIETRKGGKMKQLPRWLKQKNPSWTKLRGWKPHTHCFSLVIGICQVNVSLVVKIFWIIALILRSVCVCATWETSATTSHTRAL